MLFLVNMLTNLYIMLINVFNICGIKKTYINYGRKFICNVSKVLKLCVVI